jgi:hypothetical protein
VLFDLVRQRSPVALDQARRGDAPGDDALGIAVSESRVAMTQDRARIRSRNRGLPGRSSKKTPKSRACCSARCGRRSESAGWKNGQSEIPNPTGPNGREDSWGVRANPPDRPRGHDNCRSARPALVYRVGGTGFQGWEAEYVELLPARAIASSIPRVGSRAHRA